MNLDEKINAVCKASHDNGAAIHSVAVEALTHASEHGDAMPLDRLIKGLHKSARPVALKAWIETYSPVRWNGDGKVGLLKEGAKQYTPFAIEAADLDPYWEQKEVVPKPLTLATLKAMAAQMQKKLDKAAKGDLEIGEGENIVVMRDYVNRVMAA